MAPTDSAVCSMSPWTWADFLDPRWDFVGVLLANQCRGRGRWLFPCTPQVVMNARLARLARLTARLSPRAFFYTGYML